MQPVQSAIFNSVQSVARSRIAVHYAREALAMHHQVMRKFNVCAKSLGTIAATYDAWPVKSNCTIIMNDSNSYNPCFFSVFFFESVVSFFYSVSRAYFHSLLISTEDTTTTDYKLKLVLN